MGGIIALALLAIVVGVLILCVLASSLLRAGREPKHSSTSTAGARRTRTPASH